MITFLINYTQIAESKQEMLLNHFTKIKLTKPVVNPANCLTVS